MTGIPGVHGMPHFMGYGRYTVQCARKVGHDIGIRMIGTGTERAAALTAVWIDIDPPGGKAFADDLSIGFSQRGDSVKDHLLCLFIAVVPAAASCQRCVKIIIVEFIQVQKLFPQFRIAVHGRQVSSHRLDESIIDLHRNIFSRHGHGTGGSISAHSCFGRCRLDSTGIGGGKSIDMLAVSLIKTEESVLAQCPVRACLEKDIVGAGKLVLLSVTVPDRIENQIRVLEVVRNLSGRRKNLSETRQQRLFLFR